MIPSLSGLISFFLSRNFNNLRCRPAETATVVSLALDFRRPWICTRIERCFERANTLPGKWILTSAEGNVLWDQCVVALDLHLVVVGLEVSFPNEVGKAVSSPYLSPAGINLVTFQKQPAKGWRLESSSMIWRGEGDDFEGDEQPPTQSVLIHDPRKCWRCRIANAEGTVPVLLVMSRCPPLESTIHTSRTSQMTALPSGDRELPSGFRRSIISFVANLEWSARPSTPDPTRAAVGLASDKGPHLKTANCQPFGLAFDSNQGKCSPRLRFPSGDRELPTAWSCVRQQPRQMFSQTLSLLLSFLLQPTSEAANTRSDPANPRSYRVPSDSREPARLSALLPPILS
ncbi:hypothetical protein BDK51DRAFT_41415 [Blyttiomyces helicus]|uniref:Uncharacterized protein n=1 Tax=Blyttiomyces helicus TaxID=388810 RepID=A0A4P9W380_9FUNG|nr:hypothetical protein BDK51DRAFT_41415 [Blyttiomyces helicus]|eukprot:RKO86242.1 hypothetical protein BDK51DRAFT_41415 [Blyttiomyces helicus]